MSEVYIESYEFQEPDNAETITRKQKKFNKNDNPYCWLIDSNQERDSSITSFIDENNIIQNTSSTCQTTIFSLKPYLNEIPYENLGFEEFQNPYTLLIKYPPKKLTWNAFSTLDENQVLIYNSNIDEREKLIHQLEKAHYLSMHRSFPWVFERDLWKEVLSKTDSLFEQNLTL